MREYRANQEKILENYTQVYDVCQVFCAFESETSQRTCLKELTAGLVPSLFDIQTVNDAFLFRGNNQLIVAEAPEAHDVCWENLGQTTRAQYVQQKLCCFCYLGLLNCACGMVVYYSFISYPGMVTTIIIGGIDEYVPALIRLTIDATEAHGCYSGRQASIMTQMFVFLIVNSAIVIYMVSEASTQIYTNTDYCLVALCTWNQPQDHARHRHTLSRQHSTSKWSSINNNKHSKLVRRFVQLVTPSA
jgi:hypothetical protein